jgi:hypothetical protein
MRDVATGLVGRAAVGLAEAVGGGRLIPWAPAAAGAGVAVLAAGFPRATGIDPGVEVLAGFLVGMSLLLTLMGVLLAAAIAIWIVGARPLLAALRSAPATLSPLRQIRRAAGA